MLSTVPAFVSPEPGFGYQNLDLQTGFAPGDCSDLFSVIQSSLEPVEPNHGSADVDPGFAQNNTGIVKRNHGYEEMKTGSDKPTSDSDKLNPSSLVNRDQTNNSITLNSSSEERTHNRADSNDSVVVEERKRKRMVSNRESARRSRLRKQEHLQNLRSQVNRLGLENRELMNRLRLVLYQTHRVRTENELLKAESTVLQHRLSEMQRFLLFRQIQRQWPCNNDTIVMDQQNPSLMVDQII